MDREKDRIGIIFGGISSEYGVSLLSAETLLKAIDRSRHEIRCIGITKNGIWNITTASPEDIAADKWLGASRQVTPVEALADLDFAFPVMHGRYGEDGEIQGLFELLQIPYAGSGVHGSSLAMDKCSAKRVFRACGIPTSNFVYIDGDRLAQYMNRYCEECEAELGYPMFVKPANSGSSIGISRITNRMELEEAILTAQKYDHRIIVEESINGRELEVGVIGNSFAECSCVGEITHTGGFYDYESKYTSESPIEIVIPAPIDDELSLTIQKTAVRAYHALDCAGFARVDFLVDMEAGVAYVNEINTIPGMTQYSMFPMLWQHQNVSFTDMIETLIHFGYQAHQRFQEVR